MSRIRVLIIDKGAVARRWLANTLSGDPDIEVVGAVPSAAIAVAKIAAVSPDVLLIREPEASREDLEELEVLRQAHPTILQIHRGLWQAATGSQNQSVAEGRDADDIARAWRLQVVPRIKQTRARSQRTGNDADPAARPSNGVTATPAPMGQGPRKIDIVAIGASTGGPRALTTILSSLPANFPVPLVIVQHMLPSFTNLLANQLALQSTLPILEGIADHILQPGIAWLAPGDHHMELKSEGEVVRLKLHKGPSEHSCRPSVNVLFRSVARIYRGAALAVVLTGMGQDGLRGCEAIRNAGGQVLAQDESSSVVWGMPGAVARAGLADEILPLESLGEEIHRRVMKGRRLSFHG